MWHKPISVSEATQEQGYIPRLCNNCLLDCFDKILVNGKKLHYFYPALFKKYCECPCHHPRKAKEKGITLLDKVNKP